MPRCIISLEKELQSAVVSLRNLISHASVKIEQQIQSNISHNIEFKKEMLEWVERQGLGRKHGWVGLLSRQAVYHLILKLMLYELVRQQFSLQAASIHSLKELQHLFEVAYQKTGISAFAISFMDRITQDCDGELSANLTDVAQLVENVEENRADFVGRVYEDIIPGEERRRLGEFYTPRDIAEFMTKWAVQTGKDTVLDPACGSGTFLVESLYRLAELGCSPEEAIRNLHGIDVNPLAVLMSAVNLVARAPASRPNVDVADFLRMALWEKGKRFQAIVCNPPYSRHHELSKNYKELVGRTIDVECGHKISRLSSIYVHFFIHATTYLDEAGRMAFITSSQFLDVDYGVELKRFLARNFTLRAIILYPQDTLVFSTLTTACITLLENKKPDTTHLVMFVKLTKLPEYGELLKLIENRSITDVDWANIRLIPQSQLSPENKWSHAGSNAEKIQNLVPLRNIARVHRGIATGANDFFTLSTEETRRYGIEREFLKPVITNARAIPHYNFTKKDFQELEKDGHKVWLLSCDRPKEELKKHDSVSRYLALGEKKGLHKRYLTRTRDIWYSQEKKRVAPIVFTYMSRDSPRFVFNETQTLTLNALHTIHPVEAVAKDKTKLKALLCYLNSEISKDLLKKTGRIYGGGLLKAEPREVENLPVIDIRKLPEDELTILAELFDELCQSSREGDEIPVREKIDDTLRGII